ncbi:MAG: putative porin, partial [Flavobacterium sp.]
MSGFLNRIIIFLFIIGFSIGNAQELDVPKKEPVQSPTQTSPIGRDGDSRGSQSTTNQKAPVAKIDQYKIISKERDTILLDTSLTIQKDYRHNYWRSDQFGYLPFSNEGQVRNRLNYGGVRHRLLPSMGFQAKHHAYQEIEDIHYYQVATPLTDIYFRTVLEQGQSVDALVTLNTSERTNYSISYRGLRSLGRYLN